MLFSMTSFSDPSKILLSLQDNLFVRIPVPKRGVVCSNQGRVDRIGKILFADTSITHTVFEVPWGPKIYVGSYNDEQFFIASAPVGAGSGLMFTELYAAGAEFIIRYGSDDVKNPLPNEKGLVKIISETDNLYGYNIASGVPEEEWGASVFASSLLLDALAEESRVRNLPTEDRICHHLENYHSLRTPEKFSDDRHVVLAAKLQSLTEKADRLGKKSSFDMESAVLFRVAKDFGKHAACVLQTVNKENSGEGPYEGTNKIQALALENEFISFVLSSLLRV